MQNFNIFDPIGTFQEEQLPPLPLKSASLKKCFGQFFNSVKLFGNIINLTKNSLFTLDKIEKLWKVWVLNFLGEIFLMLGRKAQRRFSDESLGFRSSSLATILTFLFSLLVLKFKIDLLTWQICWDIEQPGVYILTT